MIAAALEILPEGIKLALRTGQCRQVLLNHLRPSQSDAVRFVL